MTEYIRIIEEIENLSHEDLVDKHMALLQAVGVSDEALPTSGPRLTQVGAVFLAALVASPGKIVSYEVLFEIRPFPLDGEGHVGVVKAQICALRATLRRAGLNYAIENVRGVGYRVSPEAARLVRETFWVDEARPVAQRGAA